VFEVIGVPSIFSMIRKVEVLTRVLTTFRVVDNGKWNRPLVDCPTGTSEAIKKVISSPIFLK
jgi:hypothetical protein